ERDAGRPGTTGTDEVGARGAVGEDEGRGCRRGVAGGARAGPRPREHGEADRFVGQAGRWQDRGEVDRGSGRRGVRGADRGVRQPGGPGALGRGAAAGAAGEEAGPRTVETDQGVTGEDEGRARW